MHEFKLADKKLRAKSNIAKYEFSLEILTPGESEDSSEQMVLLRFLNEAELREWNTFFRDQVTLTHLSSV